MTRVEYVGPCLAGVEIEHPVGRWVTVPRETPVELPDALASSLLEQVDNWRAAPATKAKEG